MTPSLPIPRRALRGLAPAIFLLLATRVAAQDSAPEADPPAETGAIVAPGDRDDAITGEQGDAERLNVYDRVEVRERADDLTGLTLSAGEGAIGAVDLQRRPLLRAGELVETVPGVIATQHSGGGKANQYFVRGFNLDHGTDFSISVAGVPVNMPSHGHGQGYADLNFLIPELVDLMTYRKGTYYADAGDFSAAGTVAMGLTRSLESALVELTGGNLDFGRLLLADSVSVDEGDLTAAVELVRSDGPWKRPDDLKKLNGLLSYASGDASRGFSLTALAYDGSWLSADQIPRREVKGGRLDRFGLLDPGPRGSTERYQLSAELHRGGSRSLTTLSGYLVSYDFRLVSDFTYFLEDPERGDQFEQVDDRWVAGLAARREWLSAWGGRAVEARAGLDLRWDDIDNGLYRTSDLERGATVREDSIQQLGAGLWADATVRWSDRLRTGVGLRLDSYDARVVNALPANSGHAADAIASPKLTIVVGPFGRTEYFIDAGWGFHSNDARGTTIRVDPVSGEPVEPVDPLVRARGAEIGVRTGGESWTSSIALFGLELDSELVFVGDGGATEASRPSRRLGIEWSNTWRASRWLALDADLTWTDAEFTDNDPAGDKIPGAIGRTVAAGLAMTGSGRWSGALRWRYFADVPLIEDASVVWASSSLVNAALSYQIGPGLEVRLAIFNLFDREDSDIEYFYASRLRGEPLEGVEDVHFHPMESRSARLSLRWRL